jgi:hypothetical protein
MYRLILNEYIQLKKNDSLQIEAKSLPNDSSFLFVYNLLEFKDNLILLGNLKGEDNEQNGNYFLI